MSGTFCRCPQGRCNDLARRYRQGDREAGNELVLAYQPLVWGIVLRILGPSRREDWEDAAQTALLQALLAVSRWREDCPFCCYLGTVVTCRCIDFVRHLDADRFKPMPPVEPQDCRPPELEPDVLDLLDRSLAEFPTDYQEAWRLYMEDVPIMEIAGRLGVRERAIYYRWATVRRRLAEVLLD